ncbi:hypothetical protein F2Q69_00036586 [Brassica cretica]|uniref:Uncharacterized protein n=1 Tax=Brassica cretica TaxID=69181 RepID=A0A8S9SGT9_BRACR|nr:hypothetical protein F2Q69_00036586 [Brassica cretica]
MDLNSRKHGLSLLRSSGDSIRSDRAGRALGRYVATEPWLELGHYVATGLESKFSRCVAIEPFRTSIRHQSMHSRQTFECYLPKTVASSVNVFRYSNPSIKLCGLETTERRALSRYVATELGRARSLRSDRAGRSLGCYVATEPWLELGYYVATELGRARSLHSDRAGRSLGHYVAIERDDRSVTTDRAGRALGCYVATEPWLELGLYAATERDDRSVST